MNTEEMTQEEWQEMAKQETFSGSSHCQDAECIARFRTVWHAFIKVQEAKQVYIAKVWELREKIEKAHLVMRGYK